MARKTWRSGGPPGPSAPIPAIVITASRGWGSDAKRTPRVGGRLLRDAPFRATGWASWSSRSRIESATIGARMPRRLGGRARRDRRSRTVVALEDLEEGVRLSLVEGAEEQALEDEEEDVHAREHEETR